MRRTSRRREASEVPFGAAKVTFPDAVTIVPGQTSHNLHTALINGQLGGWSGGLWQAYTRSHLDQETASRPAGTVSHRQANPDRVHRPGTCLAIRPAGLVLLCAGWRRYGSG